MSKAESLLSDDLDGNKIELGSEYKLGKIGILDIYSIMMNEIKKTEIYQKINELTKNIDYMIYFDKLKKGDPIAISIAGISFIIGMYLAYSLLSFVTDTNTEPELPDKKKKEEDEKEPLRDFTLEQLKEYDGIKNKSIYIGLCGEIFDVTSASDFYGVGNSYHCFAGRNATRAMAKLSFDEEDLSNQKIDDLGPFERSTLEDWYEKFKYYKCYPIIGKYSIPPTNLTFTKEELLNYKGLQEVNDVSRIDTPIYMAIKKNVLDVSYGGKEMYGINGPYHRFTGIDASRALAKMSFDPSDIASSDLSDLQPEQLKILDDWEKKFIDVKKYPIVGTLI